MKQALFILLALLLASSCNKTSKDGGESSSLSVAIAGATNLGKVQMGDFRHTGIRIENNTGSDVTFNLPVLNLPFSWDGYTGSCVGARVPAGTICTIKIKFEPVDTDDKFANFVFLGKSFNLLGRGLRIGELTLGVASWNAGSFLAGDPQLRTITTTNVGDASISIPKIINQDVKILTHSCGEEIAPSETCNLVLSITKTSAQEYEEDIFFYTTENPLFLVPLRFLGETRPNVPSGVIEFQNADSTIIADGVEIRQIESRPIRDQFGNVVSDGSVIVANLQNLEQVEAMSKTTLNGVVTYNVRSTNITGVSRVVLSGGNATGVLAITSISGPPVGVISLKSFNNQLLANNVSFLTVETTTLVSSSGNAMTDGTPMYVTLTGPGQIITQEPLTAGGVLRVRLKSTFVSGPGELVINGGPIRDGLGNITGYQSEGRFPLDFLPVPLIGNFNLTSALPAIHSSVNGDGHPYTTRVTVDDIRDEFMNLVGANRDVSITITNGKNENNQTSFTAKTDALSRVAFDLYGIGVRDWIGITATVNNQSKFHRVFAYSEQSQLHNRGTNNKITLKTARKSSVFATSQLAPNSTLWRNVETNYYSIRSQDTSYYGSIYAYGYWRELEGPKRHLVWDCIHPMDNYVVMAPCMEKKMVGDTYIYRPTSLVEMVPHRDPENYMNSYITVLPDASSGIGGEAIGTISVYDSALGQIQYFGGVYKEPQNIYDGATGTYRMEYGIENVDKTFAYKDVPLMTYLPKVNAPHDEPVAFPIAASYHRYKDEVYIIGGIKKGGAGLTYGNKLQHYRNGNITSYTVLDGVNGTPIGRYNNGVYYNPKLNTVYLLGGRNSIGMFLDEVWKVDMNQTPKRWTQVCDLCGLPTYSPVVHSQLLALGAGGTLINGAWITLFESLFPPMIYEDSSTGKTFMSIPNSPTISEVNLELGIINNSVTDVNFLDFRNFAQLIHNQKSDRFFRHTIAQAGTMNTRFHHKDGRNGEMRYYMAEVSVDPESTSFARTLTPVISAYSQNRTINGATSVTEYGVSAYIFNFSTNLWELIGESTSTTPNFMSSQAFNIRRTIPNGVDYIRNDKAHILIKPTQELGRQVGGNVYPAENHFLINSIRLDGVM